jgi:hypothetical protein
MRLRELYTTLILESVADVIKRLKTTYPDQVDYINSHANWIRKTFPKGAEWYMLIIADVMSGDQSRLQKRLGNYAVAEFNNFQSKLEHFSTIDYQPIKDYAFNAKPVSEVLDELIQLEDKWKYIPTRPLQSQQGDYVIKDYGNGYQWWFVDRAFCSEEGRSGKHCGNVVGQTKQDQRILSLRHKMRVNLTFILETNGFLGEMKATGNQKPDAKLHPYIMDILLSDFVKGIKGAGWGPEFNFSIFDLDKNNLNIIMQQRPSFIKDQILATPREILRAPEIIRNDPQYQEAAIDADIDMEHFFVNGKLDDSIEAWERAIAANPTYVVHGPTTLKNYKQRVIEELAKSPHLFLEAPRHIIKDQEITNAVVKLNPESIRHIPPAGHTAEMYEIAVAENGNFLSYVPEELRTIDLCKKAVIQSGSAIHHVPEKLKTNDMFILAIEHGCPLYRLPEELRTPENYLKSVKTKGTSLMQVPDELRTPEICKAALKLSQYALSEVPSDLITPQLCKFAVEQFGEALNYVPEEFRTPEIYKIAVSKYGVALRYIPDHEITPELCKLAVKNDGYAIRHVPEDIITRDLCLDAVKTSNVLQNLPDQFKDYEICKAAVTANGWNLNEVPKKQITLELCEIAMAHDGTLRYVPERFKTPEICAIGIDNHPWELQFVPYKLRTFDRCLKAVKSDGALLNDVPEEHRTVALCNQAVTSSAAALPSLPAAIAHANPQDFYRLCRVGLIKGFHNFMGDGNGGDTATSLLEFSGYRELLPPNQQKILSDIAKDLDIEYGVHDDEEYDYED